MSSVISLGRLLWRPAALLCAFPLFLALSWPYVLLPEGTDGVPIRLALWSHSIILMGLLGALLSGAAREAHQPAFAFVVPSLRASLLRGKLIVGIAVASVIALAMLSTADVSESAAIFGCALMYFAIATSATDSASPFVPAPAGFVLFVASGFQPGLVRTIFSVAPWIAAGASLLVAFLLLRGEWGTNAARSRAIQPVVPAGYPLTRRFKRAYAGVREHESAHWRASPATGRLRDWIRAAHHETFGWSRYGWTVGFGTSLLIFCGMAFGYLGDPGFAGVMGLLHASWSGHRLLGRWQYPITRTGRADLRFSCSLIDSVAWGVGATGIMWLLEYSGVPRFAFALKPGGPSPGVGIIPLVMLWAPLVQWVAIAGPMTTPEIFKSPRWGIQHVAHLMAVVILAHMTYKGLAIVGREYTPAIALLAAGVLAVLVQGVYWVFLRRLYARRDLA